MCSLQISVRTEAKLLHSRGQGTKGASIRTYHSFVRFQSEKTWLFFPNGTCVCVLKAQRVEPV